MQELEQAEASRRATEMSRYKSWHTWNRDPRKLEEFKGTGKVRSDGRAAETTRQGLDKTAESEPVHEGGGVAQESISMQVARVQTSQTLLELGITADREDSINR